MNGPHRALGKSWRIVGLLALVLTGCGSKTSTVTGTVRYQGQNLTGGSVILYCETQQIVHGIIAQDGTFSITDVPRGKAVVTVKTHPRVPEGMQFKQKLPPATADGPRSPAEGAYAQDRPLLIPLRYATPEESGLSVVIDRGQLTYDIDLRP